MSQPINLSESSVLILESLVELTQQGKFDYLNKAFTQELSDHGLIETNDAMIGPDGVSVAGRATAAGEIFIQNRKAAASPAPVVAPWGAAPAPVVPAVPEIPVVALPFPQVAPAPVEEKAPRKVAPPIDRDSLLVGQANIVLPKKAKRAVGKRLYDFGALPIGGYIFVPATPERPDPRKSLSSSVSNANKEFADYEPRRVFRALRVSAEQKLGDFIAPADGCLVVRIDPLQAVLDAEDESE